jgi:CAAX prenyl protease-like protein
MWVSDGMSWFARDPNAQRNRTVNRSAPFLLPLLAVVATGLVTGIFVEQFDYLYPLRVVIAVAVLFWFRRDYAEGLRHQLRGRRLWSWEAAAIGVLVYLTWISVAALTSSDASDNPPNQLAELTLPFASLWVTARVFGSCITIPIVEELAFRGFLLRRFIDRDFTNVSYEKLSWPAVLITSIAFAAVHQQWIAGFLAGVLYALAQLRRGLLSDAIIAHAVTNLLIAVQVLCGGYWSLW